jgi:hypothetical protein
LKKVTFLKVLCLPHPKLLDNTKKKNAECVVAHHSRIAFCIEQYFDKLFIFFLLYRRNPYSCLRPKELLRIHFSPKESTSAETLFCNQRIHARYFSAHSARFQSSAVVRNENLAMQNGERTIYVCVSKREKRRCVRRLQDGRRKASTFLRGRNNRGRGAFVTPLQQLDILYYVSLAGSEKVRHV